MVNAVRGAIEKTVREFQKSALSKEAQIEAVRQVVSQRSPFGDGKVQNL